MPFKHLMDDVCSCKARKGDRYPQKALKKIGKNDVQLLQI